MLSQSEVVMTSSGTNPANQTTSRQSETEVIDTRFGKIAINRKNPIIFSKGLLGMPNMSRFCLLSFPSEKMARFKLLQSLDDLELSFITLPVDLNNPVVARADLEQAAKDLDIPLGELATLLIVTVHRERGTPQLSVNARAPVFLHASQRRAMQQVLANADYAIRHMITGGLSALSS